MFQHEKQLLSPVEVGRPNSQYTLLVPVGKIQSHVQIGLAFFVSEVML